ncbi:type II secretion system major pseudopilin GspG [Stieleria mannarensis]|uniref:type II secretion system major pseudopilin GspG n=1 Tax=Stieleria mannarensis TaxID=2755585 RepID=UPI001603FD39|nr:type II secretion system major pseudopilin GspG [Rhodopirellula sp. JC639]
MRFSEITLPQGGSRRSLRRRGEGSLWLGSTQTPRIDPPLATLDPPYQGGLSGGARRGRTANRGFSLVELIVVMVILGMLAGLVAVRTRGYLINSRKNAVKAEIATILGALETFRIDQGRYPTEDEGLEVLREETETWPEGFLTKVPVDPWKNPYLYFVSEEGVEVISLGADGREGGEGEDADFSSTMLEE